jgi:hypothetical protein
MKYNLEKPEDCVQYLYDLSLEAPCSSVKLGAEITNNANHCFTKLSSIIQELNAAKIDLENLQHQLSMGKKVYPILPKDAIPSNKTLEEIIKSQIEPEIIE